MSILVWWIMFPTRLLSFANFRLMIGIPMGLGAGFKLMDKEKEKEKDKDKEKEKTHDKPRSKHKEKEKDESERARRNGEEHDISSGWTSMLEDWLCQGNASSPRTVSPTVADIGSPKPLSPRISLKEPRKGPYQLLSKERMMGIYLAVYIHRDVRPLVKGEGFLCCWVFSPPLISSV